MPPTPNISADPVSLALQGGQAVLGAIQAIGGKQRAKRLMQQRKAYQTPEEYFDILNATENMAQQGFDAFTLNYLTNQADRAFDANLDASVRLGADPNQLSSAFDQKMQSILKIGSENARLNMENFSRYLGALESIGESKTAEWKSQQDLLKDQLQAANADQQSGLQNIFGAANSFMTNRSADKISNLFTQKAGGKNAAASIIGALSSGNLPGTTQQSNNPFEGMTPEDIQMLLNGYFGK